MRFIDTNIIIRHLAQPATPIDQARHLAATALFRRIQRREEQARICEAVISEVLYVLCSPRQYGLSHVDATARLRPTLRLRGLRIPNKRVYLRALDLFAAYPHLDFEDTVIIAHMEREREPELYSYDTDFDRIPAQ